MASQSQELQSLQKSCNVQHLANALIPTALLCSDLLAASAMVQAGSNAVSYCWQQDKSGFEIIYNIGVSGFKERYVAVSCLGAAMRLSVFPLVKSCGKLI